MLRIYSGFLRNWILEMQFQVYNRSLQELVFKSTYVKNVVGFELVSDLSSYTFSIMLVVKPSGTTVLTLVGTV